MKGISLAVAISLVGVAIAPPFAEASPPSLRATALSAQSSRYQEAEAVWQRIAASNPDNAEAFYNLGIAQANQQKWQAAIESYEQAIALDPELAQAYCSLGLAQSKLEQFELAAQSYRYALWLNPGDSLAEGLLKELEIVAQSRGLDLAIRPESSSF